MSRVCLDQFHHVLWVAQVHKADGAITTTNGHHVWLVRVTVKALHGSVLTRSVRIRVVCGKEEG